MNIFEKRINKPKEMVDPNKLMRGNFLQFGLDRVQVLTIAKKSIRVYNVTQDSYINTWVELKDFEYVPISMEVLKDLGWRLNQVSGYIYKKDLLSVEILESEGYFKLMVFGTYWNDIEYANELQNVVNIFSE